MIIHPPHPIPYPDKPFIRMHYPIPILLYQLGLGKLIGKHILIISTIGRKSGKVRRRPIEYHQKGDWIYAISGFAQDPDWYRNLLAHPYVALQNDQVTRQVFARRLESEAEWEGALEYLTKSPGSGLSIPDVINHLADPERRGDMRTITDLRGKRDLFSITI